MYDTTIANYLLLLERVNSPTEAIYDRGEISLVGLSCFIDILLKHIAMELITYAALKILNKKANVKSNKTEKRIKEQLCEISSLTS